jgi:hypothetical protein
MGTHIFHRLRQVFAQFTFYLSTFGIRLRTWIDFRFTKNYEKFEEVKTIANLHHNQLAIVVLFPRASLLKSAIRLIDALLDSKYSVLIVMNESKHVDEWKLALTPMPVEILVRPNIGRDFAAFRAGYLYAEKRGYVKEIQKLAFANDSVFYGPGSPFFVKNMLEIDGPWNSMFVNYQFHTHAQSFFQFFSKEVFADNSFSEFWKKYYPSELRHHAINNGEVALSSLCIKNGYAPVSFVTPNMILNSKDFYDFTDDEKFGIWSNHGATYLNKELSTFENTKFLMKRQYLENNVTHHQGLLASRVLKAPLKLDIFRTGQVTKEGLVETLENMGCDADEITEVLQVMTLRGSHASRRGFSRLWSIYGYA